MSTTTNEPFDHPLAAGAVATSVVAGAGAVIVTGAGRAGDARALRP